MLMMYKMNEWKKKYQILTCRTIKPLIQVISMVLLLKNDTFHRSTALRYASWILKRSRVLLILILAIAIWHLLQNIDNQCTGIHRLQCCIGLHAPHSQVTEAIQSTSAWLQPSTKIMLLLNSDYKRKDEMVQTPRSLLAKKAVGDRINTRIK